MTYEPTPEDLREMELVYAISDIEHGLAVLKDRLADIQEDKTEKKNADQKG